MSESNFVTAVATIENILIKIQINLAKETTIDFAWRTSNCIELGTDLWFLLQNVYGANMDTQCIRMTVMQNYKSDPNLSRRYF